MKLNDLISGFRVLRAQKTEECGGTLWLLRHEKTGAPLYWLDNGTENKVFSVAFKTVPWDHTGVFHILEHSVLCGSQKYPVKEPFVDLLKSSMNTFLNAFTFQDKTMYPVASRNNKDFVNLVSVYLDAVFRPMITGNRSIFMQEGTRIDFDGEAPTFNGVVYNEMKGAASDLYDRLYEETNRLLFPDSPYRFNSGGDPAAIPSLTYEGFLEAYRRFYHPSNSVIYLDGAVPMETVLPLIDGYLAAFELSAELPQIPLQKPVAHAEVTAPYEIGESESPEKKTWIALGRLAGPAADQTRMYALEVLQSYLFGSNDAPVKRAVLATGLAEDVTCSVNTGTLQPYTWMIFKNTEAAHKNALLAAVKTAAAEAADAGLDAEDLAAEIDTLELRLKEPDEPQGIERAISVSDAVFFGLEPLSWLEHGPVLAALREKIGTSYYTDLIREFLVEADNTALVTLVPDPGMGKREAEAEAERLQKTLSGMDEAALAQAKEQFAAFKAWQETPDSPEQKATLPTLAVSDVPETLTPFVTESREENGRCADHHPAKTGGVAYVRLLFSGCDLDPAALPALAFVAELMGKLPTKKHTALELDRLFKRCTGWHKFSMLTASGAAADEAKCVLNAAFSALSHRLPQALSLMSEVLTETVFADRDKIKDILSQTRDGFYRRICSRGSRFAGMRAVAASNAEAAADDAVSGVSYYRWLKAFEADFDARFDDFAAQAAALLERLCVSARLSLSETSDVFHSGVLDLCGMFPRGEAPQTETIRFTLPGAPRKEAFFVPGGVSFAGMGTDMRKLGCRYRGEMEVLAQIMSYGYLWDAVRVRGGAYGCGCVISDAETVRFTSFRDPTPLRSLDVFRDAAAWLRDFCREGAPIDNYVISTAAAVDPLRAPRTLGFDADVWKLKGKTEADRIRILHELLSTTRERLNSFASLLESAAAQSSACVIGCREALADLPADWACEEL